MGKAQSIIKKLDTTLRKKAGNPPRLVYKRIVTTTGGDALIGRGGTTTYTDTLLDPQPYVSQVKRRRNQYHDTEVMNTDEILQVTDLSVLLSPTSITADELEDPQLVIVMIDGNGDEVTYQIVFWDSVYLQGTYVFYKAILRSVAR